MIKHSLEFSDVFILRFDPTYTDYTDDLELNERFIDIEDHIQEQIINEESEDQDTQQQGCGLQQAGDRVRC